MAFRYPPRQSTGHTIAGPRKATGYVVEVEYPDGAQWILHVIGGGRITRMTLKEAESAVAGVSMGDNSWDEESNLGTLVGELTSENRRKPGPKGPYEIKAGETITIMDDEGNPQVDFDRKTLLKDMKVVSILETMYDTY